MATSIIAANLPDIDGLLTYSLDDRFWWRRGHSHGVLAMILLPAILTAAVVIYDRWRRGRSRCGSPPVDVRVIATCAALGVWSHSLLDWLNVYGVRLAMPFDGRWYYGDTLFILDPWLWLLAGLVPFVAFPRGWRAAWVWLPLLATTLAVFWMPDAPIVVQTIWALALAGAVMLRSTGWGAARRERLARICLGVSLVYIVLMGALAGAARQGIASHFTADDKVEAVDFVFARPMPATPLTWEGVVRRGDDYHFVRAQLGLRGVRVDKTGRVTATMGPQSEAVLASPEHRGFANWLRFPAEEVEATEFGWRVRIFDLRYIRSDTPPTGSKTRFGEIMVELDHQLDLRPSAPAPGRGSAS